MFWFFYFLIALSLIFCVLVLFHEFFFLRKPKRIIPSGNCVVSPASGIVKKIIPVRSGEIKHNLSKGKLGLVKLMVDDTIKTGYIVVIVMNIWDVHFQRSPVSGVIKNIHHSKGLFGNAVKDVGRLNTLYNEKTEVLINNSKIGLIKVIQVAGFIARRIHVSCLKKQKVLKGGVIGYISFGSQVLLVLPDLDIKVKEGQRVVDGESVIAVY